MERMVPLAVAESGNAWLVRNAPSMGVTTSNWAVTRTLTSVPEQALMEWNILTVTSLMLARSMGVLEACRTRASMPVVSDGL